MRQRKLGALAAILVLAGLLVWWLGREAPEAARLPADARPDAPLPRFPLVTVLREPAETASTAPPAKPALPPLIEAVEVEKQSVCEGEENLVSVRARSVDGTNGFLRYNIAGEEGPSVPLRRFLGEDGNAGVRYVRVFGKDGVVASAPIPQYEVRPCRPEHVVQVQARLMPNSESEFEFYAELRANPQAKPFFPLRFEWTFGDGSKQTTREPRALHSYEERAQESSYSYVLIQVEAVTEDGERLKGRRSLELQNAAYDDLERAGVVRLMTRATPRFPELDANGVVTQRFRVFHVHDRTVHLDRVVHSRHPLGDGDVPASEELAPEVLGISEIPPGEGVEVVLTLDTKRETNLFMHGYELFGTSEDDRAASGSISILRPQGIPTAEEHVPVDDPVLTAKILATREILG
ncbi:MAG TPA: hypothetical protein VGK73_20385, partial [Polyangiaceae bacterium]